jgi:hypothetical protein
MHSTKKPGIDSILMTVPQGEFRLERNPKNDLLRAWDAADEYLLHQVY